jgi:hypothetical protein
MPVGMPRDILASFERSGVWGLPRYKTHELKNDHAASKNGYLIGGQIGRKKEGTLFAWSTAADDQLPFSHFVGWQGERDSFASDRRDKKSEVCPI